MNNQQRPITHSDLIDLNLRTELREREEYPRVPQNSAQRRQMNGEARRKAEEANRQNKR